MFSVSKAEHASSKGPTLKLHVMEDGGRGGGGGATGLACLVAKQAVEFPQVLANILAASIIIFIISSLGSFPLEIR